MNEAHRICLAVAIDPPIIPSPNRSKQSHQEFFEKDMGLPLEMTPNYDDFSCQFAFGKTPRPQAADNAFATPCFSQCPSKKRAFEDANGGAGDCPNIAVLR